MNDLISRQAAIDVMAELQGRAYTKAELKGISKAWKRIKQLPSAEPVTHGKWIDRNGATVAPFWERYECSLCGARSNDSNFCPNCGADMRGEE